MNIQEKVNPFIRVNKVLLSLSEFTDGFGIVWPSNQGDRQPS